MLVILQKKRCKVVLAGELRDLRDYKIAKWAFKNLGKKVSAIGIKYTVLFSDIYMNSQGRKILIFHPLSIKC